eukprot:g30198.t1
MMTTEVESSLPQATDHGTSLQPSDSSNGGGFEEETTRDCLTLSSASGGDEEADNDLLARLELQPGGRDQSEQRSGPLEVATDPENKENDQSQRESAEKLQKKFTEAPPPKINPWTKKKNMVTNNSVNVNNQET